MSSSGHYSHSRSGGHGGGGGGGGGGHHSHSRRSPSESPSPPPPRRDAREPREPPSPSPPPSARRGQSPSSRSLSPIGRDEAPVVNETVAMIANMRPYLHRDTYIYTELPYEEGSKLPALLPHMHTLTTEEEAMSILVPRRVAKENGLPTNLSPRLCHIELQVRSGLEGVGLTAAVSSALSAGHIACNVVAGLRHDHLFVPEDRADMAMDVLKALAKQTRKIDREQRKGKSQGGQGHGGPALEPGEGVPHPPAPKSASLDRG